MQKLDGAAPVPGRGYPAVPHTGLSQKDGGVIQQHEGDEVSRRANEIMMKIQKENAAEYKKIFDAITHDPKLSETALKNLCLTVAEFELHERGQEKRFRKNVQTYPQLGVSLPFTFRIKKSFDGKILNVSITIPGKEGFLGEGGFKKVKSGYKIKIPTVASENQPPVPVPPKQGLFGGSLVGPRPKDVKGHKIQDAIIGRSKKGPESQRKILEGLELRKLLNTLVDDDAQLLYAEVPAQMRYKAKDNTERLELIQRRYNGDLHDAITKNEIPVNFEGKKRMVKADMFGKLEVLKPVARALGILHQKGYVHRDVKPPNILVKLSSNLKPYGALNDFDLIEQIGISNNRWNYVYWDPLGREGIVTPSSDLYGLAYSLGESMFPLLFQRLGSVSRIDNVEGVFKRELDIKTTQFF